MSIAINSNISSLAAQRMLREQVASYGDAANRLSSGLRVNSAKDDAAGLAISERLLSQIRGLSVAKRNVIDYQSLLQVAESSLSSITDIYQRIRELAVQASNGTLSDGDRIALDVEAKQLGEQINLIANQTQFNGKKLIDGSFLSEYAQIGANVNETMEIGPLIDARNEGSGGHSIKLDGDVIGALWTYDQNNALMPIINATPMFDPGNLYTGRTEINLSTPRGSVTFDANVIDQWYVNARLSDSYADAVTSGISATAGRAFEIYGLSQPGSISISTIRSGVETIYSATITDTNDLTPLADLINAGSPNIKAFTRSGGLVVYSPDIDGWYIGEGVGIKNFLSSSPGNTVKLRSLDFETYKPITGKAGASDSITLTSATAPNTDPAYFDAYVNGQVRITAEEGPLTWSIVEDRIPGSSRGLTFSDSSGETSSGSTPIDLTTIESARSALDSIDFQVNRISSARSEVGAKNNRLEAIAAQIDTSALSNQTTRGRIVDADYAVEQSNLVRSQILMESASAIVAQANAEPKIVKVLLDSIS